MHLLESGEMYIETIHVLSKKGGVVRSVDVSEHMGVSKPSVSRAIGLLKEGGYVLMARDGARTLTEAGVEVANKIYERHRVITALLTALRLRAGFERVLLRCACALRIRFAHPLTPSAMEAFRPR